MNDTKGKQRGEREFILRELKLCRHCLSSCISCSQLPADWAHTISCGTALLVKFELMFNFVNFPKFQNSTYFGQVTTLIGSPDRELIKVGASWTRDLSYNKKRS